MNELIQEIEEDIRRERIDMLWNRFGRVMVAVSLVVIATTIVMVVVKNHKQAVAMEATAKFIQGADRMAIEDYKGAIAIFDELAKNDSSYYGLAMLRKAQAQQGLKNKEDAAKTYQELAAHNGAFGDLAKLLAPGESGKIIEPSKDSPFYYSQREWKGWQLMNAGKKDEAIADFAGLYQDEHTPYAMRERMTEILQHIAPKTLEPDAAKAAGHE